jgi:nucleoside-diphosphate-sugar epimerase
MTLRPMAVHRLPPRVADLLALGVEAATFVLGRSLRHDVGKISPATLSICRLSYVFETRRARDALGWAPLYTLAEAVQCTVARYLERSAGGRASAASG